MFEVIHGHQVGNYSWPIDKVDTFPGDSAFDFVDYIHAGWTITFADDSLIVAEFGVRWIQISHALTPIV